MLADARTTADLVTVEAELAKRAGELESLQGRQRVLNNETGLATVNVRLTEQAGPSFAAAFDRGWTALNGLGGAALALAAFVLPFSPLVAGGVWLVRRQSRRAASRS